VLPHVHATFKFDSLELPGIYEAFAIRERGTKLLARRYFLLAGLPRASASALDNTVLPKEKHEECKSLFTAAFVTSRMATGCANGSALFVTRRDR